MPVYNQNMAWLVCLLLLWPFSAQAQSAGKRAPAAKKAAAAAAPLRFPIDRITIEGNENYLAEEIIAASGLRVGQPVAQPEFDAARDRLIATGAFENVGYRYEPSGGQGYAVTLEVQEVRPVYPFRFDSLPATDEELAAVVRSASLLRASRIPASELFLQRYAEAIEKFLAQRNEKVKVVGRLTVEGIEDLTVVFRPDGPVPTIAEVRFENVTIVPVTVLQRAIHGTAVGSLYTESRFRIILDNTVRPIYENRGRVRVSFPRITVEPAKDVKGQIVTVAVDEGDSYELGEVRVEGTLLSAEVIEKEGNFKKGDLANLSEIHAGVERIHKRLRREGYLKATSRIDREVNDESRTVDITVTVSPGPQFRFRRLHIQGLDLHGEAAIKKLWGMKEDRPFDAEYPDYFLARVREENMFDNLGQTRSEAKLDEKSQTVDVVLHFR